ncbi:MAG TPA: nitroreductase, partial [Puia sp.]|nr:nitroreductase [Puia sp.]
RCIYERRAVRTYEDRPVPVELVARIVDAGKMAPSAMNRQPWKFYLLTTPDTIRAFSREIAACLEGRFHLAHGVDPGSSEDPIFHGAPVVIFLTAPRDDEWAALDIGMCAENMMLAAHSLGLATCPIGLAKFLDKTKIVSSLHLGASEQVILAIALGYGSEMPERHQRVGDNVVFVG